LLSDLPAVGDHLIQVLHEISIFRTVIANVGYLSVGIINVSRLQLNERNEDMRSLLQNK